MLQPATNIAVTRWATIAFEVIVDFDPVVPVYSLVPDEGKTLGARFESFAEVSPGSGLFLVTYRLDYPLQYRERTQLAQAQLNAAIGAFDPFIPVPLTLQLDGVPGSDEIFQMVVITNGKFPPQFSPSQNEIWNILIERNIPGVVAGTPP